MKKISWLIIIIGITVMLTPIVGNIITRYNEQRLITEWVDNTSLPESISNVTKEEAFEALSNTFTKETKAEPTKVPVKKAEAKQNVLGIIKIEKIKVNLPIVEGVDDNNLKAGIGHMPGTAGLGEVGNCVLAGHRNYTFGRFFNRLDEVEIGDEITVKTKDYEYTYVVFEKYVVLPEDTSVINKRGDDSIITLITCTPIRKATHRLIIHGSLKFKS